MMPTRQLFAPPRQHVGGCRGGIQIRYNGENRHTNTLTAYESIKFRGVWRVSCCLSWLLIDLLRSGPLDRSRGFNGTACIEVSPHRRNFWFFLFNRSPFVHFAKADWLSFCLPTLSIHMFAPPRCPPPVSSRRRMKALLFLSQVRKGSAVHRPWVRLCVSVRPG